LQTAFIFEELDGEDGAEHDGKGGKDGNVDIAESMWTASRRILAAMQMLFMALDVSIDDVDWLGRPNRLPNIMDGDGMDDAEYEILKNKGLLTSREISVIKAYPGFKCQVPIKWALTELRDLCKPEDRTKNQAKNYEAMQEIAANFNKTAVVMVCKMQQPVPFVYFHVLKLMMMMVNGLIAYELVNLFEEVSWTISVVTFSTICAMLLGLQEIAGAMADPFGSDDTDFDTNRIVDDAYKNAVSYLTHNYPPDLSSERPTVNPLRNALSPHISSTAKFASPTAAIANKAAELEAQLDKSHPLPAPIEA